MTQTIPVSPGLHTFHGGVHLPINKDMSVQVPVKDAALPEQLILPLQQHIGQVAEPLVKVGDHVLKGQIIAKAPSYVSAPIHAPTSGTIRMIGEHPVPHPSGLLADCIIIEPDGADQWTELHPVEDYTQLDPVTLRNKVRDAGIVGLGGAAFPSAVKLNPGPNRNIELLVINGAECEPYITCDQTLMTERADEVIGGIQIIMHTIGVNECWIGIEDTMPTVYEGLTKAIENAGEQDRIQVKVIPTIYPTGGEKQLIKVLTGREVPSNGLPAEIGIVCHNPGTATAIYRAVTLGEPLVSRLITVTGLGVKQPRNLHALFGTPMSHLVAEAEGYTDKAERLIMGGPMMGFAVHSDELPIVKATNCVLVAEASEIADPQAADPCIRCGACADACPANLLPQQLYWYSKSRQFEQAQDDYNLFDCIECGCCSFVCPSNIPLVQYYRFAKTEIRTAEADKRKADRAKDRHDFRLERLEREQREKAEALRKKKEELARKQAQAETESSGSNSKQDAIAAAVARAQARKAQLAQSGDTPKNTTELSASQQAEIDKADARRNESNSDSASDAKAAAIAAAKAKAQASPAKDAKQAAIEAAKARAAAKASEEASTETQDPKQAAIAAARAKALAKSNGNTDAAQDAKQAAIAAAKARAQAKSETTQAEDPRQAAIEAAKARALAKQNESASSNEEAIKETPAVDAKQAAIAAAKARAMAKQSGEAIQENPAQETGQDAKQAAIAAAKARALAKANTEDKAEEPAKPDALDAKQKAIQAARERALAKAKEKDK